MANVDNDWHDAGPDVKIPSRTEHSTPLYKYGGPRSLFVYWGEVYTWAPALSIAGLTSRAGRLGSARD